MDMSRHPAAEQPYTPAVVFLPCPSHDVLVTQAEAQQAASLTVRMLAESRTAHFASDAERLCLLLTSLAAGEPILAAACGAFNRATARAITGSGIA
jgi:hypothetical protein